MPAGQKRKESAVGLRHPVAKVVASAKEARLPAQGFLLHRKVCHICVKVGGVGLRHLQFSEKFLSDKKSCTGHLEIPSEKFSELSHYDIESKKYIHIVMC